MLIRDFSPGDEARLRAVFHSSVHALARRHYTPEQCQAWAPADYDAPQWAARLRHNRPFVVEQDGVAVAYADLQPSGYIDHFFVAGAWAGRGIGAALLAHLRAVAAARGIPELSADVSLCAEAFFSHHGFSVERRQTVPVRGVELANARMRLGLAPPAGPPNPPPSR